MLQAENLSTDDLRRLEQTIAAARRKRQKSGGN
jgi:hypothetical protein